VLEGVLLIDLVVETLREPVEEGVSDFEAVLVAVPVLE